MFDTYAIERVYDSRGVANAKAKIDDAVANNGWLVYGQHVWMEHWSESDTREVIEYAISKGMEFVTIEEGLKRFGNLIDIDNEFGNYRVGADGSGLEFQRISSSGLTIDTPISGFPIGKSMTAIGLGHPAVSSFPDAGIIETTHNSANYNYQDLITYTGREVYRRYWISENWTPFEKITNTHMMRADNSTPISQFKSGISINNVTSSSASGLPGNSAGTLITYKFSVHAYCFQEFKKYNSTEKYVRHANTDGTWGRWISTDDRQGIKAEATLSNGWTGSLEYSKTVGGKIWIRGIITAGTNLQGTEIATFPYGFSSGVYYPTFNAYNFTKKIPVSSAFYHEGRSLKVGLGSPAAGDTFRVSAYYQTTEV